MILSIVEILDRSEQGRTRPFLCRCENGRLYYVKGRDAGPRSLWCEWLAGHLGRALGLPIPEFCLVVAPEALITLHPEGPQLGTSPAFASLRLDYVQDLSSSSLAKVPLELRRDVLVFDWWLRNEDRTLTTLSGNPNLLWDGARDQLAVIDQNLAFDREFDAAGFSQTHAFADQIPYVFHDLVERCRYHERLEKALDVWHEACKNAPQEWAFADEEQTVPTDFDPAEAWELLSRCTSEDFWRLTP